MNNYLKKDRIKIHFLELSIDELYEEHGRISKGLNWLTPFFEPSDLYRERQIKIKNKRLREIKKDITIKERSLKQLKKECDIRVDIKLIKDL